MAMMKLTVIGNIGADAIQRETNGRKYTTFNVAVSSKFKNQDGSETERTTWISCARDGQSQIDQWLKRGRQVYVEGTPSLQMYTDNGGHPQCAMRLAVHRIELLGGKDETTQPQAAGQVPAPPQAAPQQPQAEGGTNDDLPF